MTMTRTVSRVLFHPVTEDGDRGAEPVELEVLITHQDKLRAETEARTKRGLAGSLGEAPITWMTLFAWYALVRTGAYHGSWEGFKNRDCVDIQEGDAERVDPTQPAPASGSHSASASTGPASTGSQPTTN